MALGSSFAIERERSLGNWRSAQLAGFVAAMIAAGSCGWPGKASCLAECESSASLQFDSPIGEPGAYVFAIGPRGCSVVLPALSASCVNINDFVAVGSRWLDSQPPRTLHVAVSKDGVEVMNGDAKLNNYATAEVCGQTCTQAQFSMAVPPELVRPFWGPCDQSKFTGTYLVNESSDTSGCGRPFTSQTVVLANGLLQMGDPTCRSDLTSWSSDTCKIQSAATCTSTLLGVTWNLNLTDVMGDGSRLLGYGDVSMSTPVSCQGEAVLELIRQ